MKDVRATVEAQGWGLVPRVVPTDLCNRLLSVLEAEMHVPLTDSARWDEYAGNDFVPMWGHQAQWDIRQLPQLHALWAQLWRTEDLWVSLDMCRFTPPWNPRHAGPQPIHWDHDPHDRSTRFIQGVLALADTGRGQGGFRCVPSLFLDAEAWPTHPLQRPWGDEWQPNVSDHEIVEVSASQGDLIVWDSRLPHANSKNTSDRPRVAFYIQMFPPIGEQERRIRIECYQTGTCHPTWRYRPGAARTEPWPPANLTALGKQLLGLRSPGTSIA